MIGVDLTNTLLERTTVRNCDLRDAKLTHADLTRVSKWGTLVENLDKTTPL
jgi:uncharacterized protein YjbI with pentapeptide repeats